MPVKWAKRRKCLFSKTEFSTAHLWKVLVTFLYIGVFHRSQSPSSEVFHIFNEFSTCKWWKTLFCQGLGVLHKKSP